MSMSLHRTPNNLRNFTEAKAMVEKRLDGDFVRGVHRGGHGPADAKRLVPEVEARKAMMVRFAKGQLPDFG